MRLVYLALAFVAYYLPIETWASWPELWHPFYVDAAIGIALLLWGAALCRRAAQPGLAVLCTGFAWMSASGWRSTFDRVFALAEGRRLDYGAAEMCFIVCSTVITIIGMIGSLVLLVRHRQSG